MPPVPAWRTLCTLATLAAVAGAVGDAGEVAAQPPAGPPTGTPAGCACATPQLACGCRLFLNATAAWADGVAAALEPEGKVHRAGPKFAGCPSSLTEIPIIL
jgi:hypothetical protein